MALGGMLREKESARACGQEKIRRQTKKDTKKTGRAAQRRWRGLTTVMAVLLVLSLVGRVMVNGFRTDIDKFLGTTSSMIVTDESVAAAALLMAATLLLVNTRVNSIAAVMTYENNASNMADLTSCIVGIAGCLVATVVSIVASFHDVVKD